ncbi:MAG TPA: hypothetical protein VFK04_00585 [Gemmatimonadaceae bacterium]|nr:hypothetical protein [Gemmatimonadaceae bacterium]
MSATTESLAMRERGTVVRVLMAGALVGVLDMLYPIYLYTRVLAHVPAIRIPQSVASGLLGQAAFEGGLATAALGLVLHFSFAYGWTLFYLVLSRRWEPLRRLITTDSGRVKAGLLFGLVVWFGMNIVIVPLSRANPAPLFSLNFFLQLIWHPIGIGLPIALLVREEK